MEMVSVRNARAPTALSLRHSCFTLPGPCRVPLALKEVAIRAYGISLRWPISRLVTITAAGPRAPSG